MSDLGADRKPDGRRRPPPPGGWIVVNGKNRSRSTCHPDEPSFVGGLCMRCHHAKVWPEKRAARNAMKTERARARAEAEGRVFRPRPPKKPDRLCKACGKPTGSQARAFCSDTCRPVLVRKARLCTRCGLPCPKGRRTCSSECAAAMATAQLANLPDGALRSEAVRSRRRRERKTKYRAPDKASTIARLTSEQGGKCKACGDEPADGLVLDHCHASNRPRFMLCRRCNAALGLMRESPEKIMGLHAYSLLCRQ